MFNLREIQIIDMEKTIDGLVYIWLNIYYDIS